MLVQDTSLPACHAGCATARTGLGEAHTLQLELAQSHPQLANCPDADLPTATLDQQDSSTRPNKRHSVTSLDNPEVMYARMAGFAKQADLLALLPQLFDIDIQDVCPNCFSRGIVIDDNGSFAVCSCVSMDLEWWAITWIEDVINRLAGQRSVGCGV